MAPTRKPGATTSERNSYNDLKTIYRLKRHTAERQHETSPTNETYNHSIGLSRPNTNDHRRHLLEERLPQAKVKLVELPSFLSVQQALLDHSIDVGLTILPLQYPQLSAVPFAHGNMAVLLPSQHPLGAKASLTLAQLQRESWLEIPTPLNPVNEAIEALCHETGFERIVAQEVYSLELLADFVQVGRGKAPIDSLQNASQLAGVVVKPLVNSANNPYSELNIQHVVAYLAGNTTPAVVTLAQSFSELPLALRITIG